MAKLPAIKIKSMFITLNEIDEFVKNYKTDQHTVSHLKIQLEEISNMSEKFEDCQAEVETVENKTEKQCLNERSTFRKKLLETKASLLELLEQDAKDKESVSAPSYSRISKDKRFNILKLPILKPPSFNGDWQQWTSFIDDFDTMFHNNEEMANIQKFHYLKSCVEGPAKEVIQNFKTTDENYQIAYSALKARYENKSAIIQSHIRSLLTTSKVVVASANELQKLYYHVSSNINALMALNQPVDQWDAWLVTLMCTRLDNLTVAEWQLKQVTKDLPKYTDLETFLSNRITAYEAGDIATVSPVSDELSKSNLPYRNKSKKVFLANASYQHHTGKQSTSPRCNLCAGPHRLSSCLQFDSMSLEDRRDLVIKNKLCFNCLYFGHQVSKCRFSPCPKCTKRHHEKLHNDMVEVNKAGVEADKIVCFGNVPNSHDNLNNVSKSTVSKICLATSIVYVSNINGIPQRCRAVIDSGAEISLMTVECAQHLKLPLKKSICPISGIGMASSSTNSIVNAKLTSLHNNDYCSKLEFHVLSRITTNLPHKYFDISSFDIPESIKTQLADPWFNVPDQIDILLGAEVSYDIFDGQKYSLSNGIVLHHTALGWVLAGKTILSSAHFNTEPLVHQTNVQSALALLTTKSESRRQEESEVESHFLTTVSRNEYGRFVVRLPLRRSVDDLGDSRHMAVKRLLNVEKRLAKDKYLAKEYEEFLAQYLDLGHMEIVPPSEISKKSYYLPHHAIIKSNSLTTKVRVVFDGSAPSKSNVSLNDIMAQGPTVQPDLLSILLRFRVHKCVLTGDVEKMYRQVKVHPSDCDLQRIVYRKSPEDPVVDYRLLTVTYGTKSASYLATKCLSQLANDTSDLSVSRTIREDFYVDDLITGSSSENKCYSMYTELCQVLISAGMPLRKWCSNSMSLLNRIPQAKDDPSYLLKLNNDETISTLGLTWQPSIDCFRFIFKDWNPPAELSKRSLLSDINKIFDPLGLLTPVLIKGKIFLQQLWCMKLGWDSLLTPDLQFRWKIFYFQFKELEKLRVPRNVLNTDSSVIELHGFSDASQQAYGACVYVKSLFPYGNITVSLYTSKSRVAPLKATTIPRLELSGALLLAELIHNIILELSKVDVIINPANIFLWSDSTIVLSWLHTSKPLKVFVSNRVAQITDITSKSQWRYVPTTCNPADVITRGIDVESLIKCNLWWNGPQWLCQDKKNWPDSPSLIEAVPETRQIKLILTTTKPHIPLLHDYSDWMRIIRITAWITRFVFNASIPMARHCDRKTGPLCANELSNAKTFWLLYVQNIAFHDDLSMLKKNQQVSVNSQIKALNPFIDKAGLIRVGGRLSQSNLPDDSKFPIVLPSNSRLVRLLFEYEHKRLLHIGPQALLAHIQVSFWPLRGRSLARSVIHHCMVCYRSKPTFLTPLMAPLPRSRVTIERPFARTGVDFCGPVYVRSGIRKVQSVKGYISVFVCFVTRAVHLELVSNLSTDAFMAALSRFMARRGQCANLYSDNGTNFVGADKELQSYFKAKPGERPIQERVTDHGIQWHFIPPAAPHFGGLWEGAVKSAKRHLLKMSGNALLNFEELSTLLCRIEAVLNSRPLTPISDSPSDFTVLTPAHFLIGGSLMLPPEPDYPEVPINKLQRWKMIRGITQGFWRRWSKEYLPQLQKRGKWTKPSRKIKIGDLAILKTDNLPVLKWNMVRVVNLHPGVDGEVRVVSVKTSNGTVLKRPVVKISLLPNSEDEEDANELN